MENRKPDYIDEDGNQIWYDDIKEFHNDGYPAIIWVDGSKSWFKHGARHNVNGSAIIFSYGNKYWYIDGVEYTEEQFKQKKIKEFIENDK